jgi:hypothetical protein
MAVIKDEFKLLLVSLILICLALMLAAFIDFFTGDEHRFKVLVKNFDDDSIIWQGVFYRTYTVSHTSR